MLLSRLSVTGLLMMKVKLNDLEFVKLMLMERVGDKEKVQKVKNNN